MIDLKGPNLLLRTDFVVEIGTEVMTPAGVSLRWLPVMSSPQEAQARQLFNLAQRQASATRLVKEVTTYNVREQTRTTLDEVKPLLRSELPLPKEGSV